MNNSFLCTYVGFNLMTIMQYVILKSLKPTFLCICILVSSYHLFLVCCCGPSTRLNQPDCLSLIFVSANRLVFFTSCDSDDGIFSIANVVSVSDIQAAFPASISSLRSEWVCPPLQRSWKKKIY